MFYPPISLYPHGGAVMLCEDAAEFDKNYDNPGPPPEEVKVEIIAMHEVDPLEKFANKLEPLYDQVIEPLMNQDFSYESPQQAIEMCEKLAHDTTNAFNTMRIKLLKFAGIACNGISRDACYDVFHSHAGVFLKNAGMIKQSGNTNCAIEWSEIKPFMNLWAIKRLIHILYDRPEILDELLYEADFAILANDKYAREYNLHTFNGFVDIMKSVFKDKERLEKMSSPERHDMGFESMLQYVTDEDTDYVFEDQYEIMVDYFMLMSNVLRRVCRETYDLQVGLADGTVTGDDYEKQMKPLINCVVNMFGLGVTVGAYYAMCLRKAIAFQKGIEAYTDSLLDTIKNRGGTVAE